MPLKPFEDRIRAVRQKLEEEKADATYISFRYNMRYLSGFTGDAGALLITANEAILFTDGRYTEQASSQAPDFRVVETRLDRDVVAETLSSLGIKSLTFESEHVTYASWENMTKRFKDTKLIPVSGWVEKLRAKKTPEEIDAIRKAAKLADDAFSAVLSSIRPGVTEREVALELEFTMRKMGSEGVAFPIIVVSGARSSLPHGEPGDKKIEPGDFVTVDFGAVWNGYVSDCTRTFVVEPLDDKRREIYEVVRKAQEAGLRAVRAGVKASEVDAAGRKVIEEAGYGQYFAHGIGHGVGLQVHESPRLGQKSEDILEPGMVVTVEPGVYIPGFGGVRIEDLVVVGDDGPEILTSFPKDLKVLGGLKR
ncbi:MAG: aminopeptidase P family protein [Firmicutes bacterium]|nr:aminopeptidase P family protein [Candidatus Fermentithermobacillaceae bacterium]